MRSILVVSILAGATLTAPNTWSVGQGDVRVTCPMTIGGSFEAKTSALSGSVTTSAGSAQSLDGSLAVDLRTLDTGIGLRNEHLREKYLEVDKGPGFEKATLSQIALKGLDAVVPEGKGSFTGVLTLHGVTKMVTGTVDFHQAGTGRRVKAAFAVTLADYSIHQPRYLGVGIKDTVTVEVTFAVTH